MRFTLMTLTYAAGVVLSFSLSSEARTNVSEKIVQLKENAEASRANLQQYEDNLKTVNANLLEVDRSIKALDRQKQALTKQTGETSKGKLGVDSAKRQIEVFQQAERSKLDTERRQIEELKRTLAQLETNVAQREQAIVLYQEKMNKVDGELASWSERNQSIVELEAAIKTKEDQAKADLKRLQEKKASYEIEVGKWKKQIRVSERQFAGYSKLKD